jgi:DNA (cytosine-5)-methyltransferase 1
MDITKTITHIGLCAGYGGIELGLERVLPNLRSIALCEIEAFACANLVAKMEAGLMDAAPIWTDLKTFPWDEFRDRVDILTGGYPCQPFSAAGKRLGGEDPRHLWPYISNGIRVLQPSICFFENVEGHISLGLSSVVSDLEELGYQVAWGIFSAAECGAPHQRRRIFILANSLRKRGQFSAKWKQSTKQVPGSEGTAWRTEDGWICTRCGSDVFDGCECDHNESQCPKCAEWTYPFVWEATDGCSSCGADWPKWNNTKSWAIEPTVCRDDDGYSSRVDRLRLLGNGVVPATAELAFRTLLNELTHEN